MRNLGFEASAEKTKILEMAVIYNTIPQLEILLSDFRYHRNLIIKSPNTDIAVQK